AISDRESVVVRGGEEIRPHDIAIWRPGNYEDYYLPGNKAFATIGKPKIMIKRLIAQSGSFIVPGVLGEPIESILSDYPSPDQCLVGTQSSNPIGGSGADTLVEISVHRVAQRDRRD